MAGLIAKLWKRTPADPYDPNLAGIGGAQQGTGPAGQSGFPGSTSATRTLNGHSPRDALIRADTNVGFDQGLEGDQVRQESRAYSSGSRNPRDTPDVVTPQPKLIAVMRRAAGEWFGGVPLRSDAIAPAVHTAGGNPLMPAQDAGGHSTYDTETPRTSRQPEISGGVPGSNNVRNTIALKYQQVPGQLHTYLSSARPDQGGAGLAESGAGGGRHGWNTPVTVPSRFVWGNGGVQTWSANRQMPYGGRGDGARGADLNGTRYYEEGPPVAGLANAGQGAYGISRLRGPNHRPVYFNEPAPWTSQYYDTTASVGTPDNPGAGGQQPQAIYVSPETGRGGLNSTGR
jgi:hypothetical protein